MGGQYYYIILSLFGPLLSSIIAGIFATQKKSFAIGVICSALIILSTISSFALLEYIYIGNLQIRIFFTEFIKTGNLSVDYGILIDSVSAIMMVTVGIVSSVVHVYSIGYMEKDKGFNKFFSYLGLFVFSMLVLVMSDNFVGLFIGWEGVGLCSWLLIGFWYDKHNYAWCANEAFIMNRIADLGLLLAMFLIFWQCGSLRYDIVFNEVANLDYFILSVIGILLFIGAMGKSAQFPFHTWLADAMAGPTPVSALIHAATMVTAGVYLVIRSNEIFSQITEVSHFIVYLGAFVAVFAASMALVHNDLKKIIAYSTLSQLGYMFVAAGFGAYWIALFHLMTHAFFKSLLFLGAGNIMHATNDELNIQKMGGLYKFLKPTAVLMIIASLALAGFYPLSGFFSKDKILEVAFNENSFFIWFVLLCGAILTAFYSFRLIMLVFFGEERNHYHAHEAKGFMLRSMGLLAALSICAGFFEHKFESFAGEILPKYDFILNHSVAILLIFITTLCVALSTIFAIFAYKKGIFKESIKEKTIYKILSNQYYIPQIYEKFITKNYFKFSEFCAKMDANFIDKSVDLIAKYILKSGGVANRTMQSGELSLMLRYMVCGFVILLVLAFVYKG